MANGGHNAAPVPGRRANHCTEWVRKLGIGMGPRDGPSLLFRWLTGLGIHSHLRSCTPRWVITLSERCAPVQTCEAVHAGLASQPGVSRIQVQLKER